MSKLPPLGVSKLPPLGALPNQLEEPVDDRTSGSAFSKFAATLRAQRLIHPSSRWSDNDYVSYNDDMDWTYE